jgi:hypothetical protein
MSDPKASAAAQFMDAVRRDFFYLQDYDFSDAVQDDRDPFRICFRSDRCIVEVAGRNYGFGLEVTIRKADDDANVNRYAGVFPLSAILLLRSPGRHEWRHNHVSGQRRMIRMDAELLRRYASDLLSGDFRLQREMTRFLRRQAAQRSLTWERETLERGEKVVSEVAEAAFRAGSYEIAEKLLSCIEDRLTRCQDAKLRYARKHLSSASQ